MSVDGSVGGMKYSVLSDVGTNSPSKWTAHSVLGMYASSGVVYIKKRTI